MYVMSCCKYLTSCCKLYNVTIFVVLLCVVIFMYCINICHIFAARRVVRPNPTNYPWIHPWSLGHHSRNTTLIDIIYRALTTNQIRLRLKPSGLYLSDGKRPDGTSLVPWKRGKVLVWNAACEETFCPSYISKSSYGDWACNQAG